MGLATKFSEHICMYTRIYIYILEQCNLMWVRPSQTAEKPATTIVSKKGSLIHPYSCHTNKVLVEKYSVQLCIWLEKMRIILRQPPENFYPRHPN